MALKIVYVLMRYPTLSQTFIEREMQAVVAQGLQVEVHPCLDFRRRVAEDAALPVGFTVRRAGSAGWVVLGGLIGALREGWARPALLWRGLRVLARHQPRHAEGWFHTLWGVWFALARVHALRVGKPDVIHGTWATAPATVAAVVGELLDIPFSFGAHAYDLHRHGGDPLLPAKMCGASFVHTTTQANVAHLRARFPERRAEIVLARRGLPELPSLHDHPPHEELRLLSVGRLVPKKGHVLQVAACRELLRRKVPFRLRMVGEGPLRPALEAAINEAGLGEYIELAGEQSPAEVQASYRWADVFWHTGIVDAQGDRDGIPNVVPEAFSHGLPVISSGAGGVGEAVQDGVTGLVVEPPAAEALADAAERLAQDAALRRQLGSTGRAWVEENFLSKVNIQHLVRAFARAAGASGSAKNARGRQKPVNLAL